MIFRRFPYTTLNDINLDWIIKQVKQIAAALQGKQDKPDAAGTAGQVLGLDEHLDPVWLDQSGGGTNNYNNLTNKPQINNVTLSGNKTAADLGLATPGDIPGYSLQLPVMDGEASAGTTYARYSMEGHRHPTDTSRASAAELATFMRPNLLDNWYFVGGGSQLGYGVFPINQRGQGTYMLSSDSYGMDRWASFQSGSKHTLYSYGVLIETNGTNYAQIAQRVSNFPQGTITISFLTGNSAPTNTVRIYIKFSDNTSEYYDCSGLGQNDLGFHSFNVSKTATEIRLYTNASGSKFSLQAVKAELGPTQTLAHQESGVWVLNEIPDYAEQLAKCQAYFIKTALASQYSCNLGLGGSNPRITIPLPATMAKVPTFTKIGDDGLAFGVGASAVIVGSSSSPIQISGGYSITLFPNAVRVAFQTTEAVGGSFLPCAVDIPAFELSAE